MINTKPRNIRYFFNPDRHPDPTPKDSEAKIRWRLEALEAEKKQLQKHLEYLKGKPSKTKQR